MTLMGTGGSHFILPLAVKRMLEECFFFMSYLTTSGFNFFKLYGSIHGRNSTVEKSGQRGAAAA